MEIEVFVEKIDNFNELSSSKQIKYFAYYIHIYQNNEIITGINLNSYFDKLHLNRHSNIHQFLSIASKPKTPQQQFILVKKGQYKLTALLREQISQELNKEIVLKKSDSIFPLAIFEHTTSYLEAFANEANICYSTGLYNSCLFMLRKICEVLITEVYETKQMSESIKNGTGSYLQLADLISAVLSEKSWKLSKIVRENLPKIKQLADSSVHSKRFKARKADIDDMKTDIRIIFDEFIHLIDYPAIRLQAKNVKTAQKV